MLSNVERVLNKRYRIVSVLGEGGMGIVYRAWDLVLQVPVALKEMTQLPYLDAQEADQWRQQFQEEALVLARLNHPNVVDVTDYFEEDGNLYLVMKFVEGESLEARIIREGALPESLVLTWADQLLRALASCHSQGALHRDIKPQNIIIQPDDQAILVDFGLVKLWDPDDPRTRTMMAGMGTLEYAPPEQFGALSGHTGIPSDIYSLGATLYHALAGQPPAATSQRMALPEQFRPVRQWNPQVTERTEAVVLRAMTLEINRRYQNAEAMRAALAGEKTTSIMSAAWKIAAGALIVGLIGVGLWWLIRSPPEPPATLIADATATMVPPAPTNSPSHTAVAPTVTRLTTATPVTPSPEPTWASPTTPPTPRRPGLGDTQISATDGMTLVYVPGGDFLMGSIDDDPDGDPDESPQHLVDLDGFWIDETEVTNAMFSQFVVDTDYVTDAERQGAGYIWTDDSDQDPVEGANWQHPHGPSSTIRGLEQHPVAQVSWHDAVAYCAWTGRHLPTEAQWEKAARGSNGQRFPWGNRSASGDSLNFADRNLDVTWADTTIDDGYQFTAPIGSYPDGASPYGALDMAGNVYEWVADWYGREYYAQSPATNPQGPLSGDVRVVRGGAWVSGEIFTRASFRNWLNPDETTDAYGFRCALSDSDTDTEVIQSAQGERISYLPVSLEASANDFLDFAFPPRGSLDLAGIPFDLSGLAFKSQASTAPHNNFPTALQVPLDVPRATRIHLLLNSGNGFDRFYGEVIGHIVAHCRQEPEIRFDLVLGQNIREWHIADNVVAEADHAEQVWRDSAGFIDLITFDLPPGCANGLLTGIELVDASSDTVNSLDPALNLTGLTIEFME